MAETSERTEPEASQAPEQSVPANVLNTDHEAPASAPSHAAQSVETTTQPESSASETSQPEAAQLAQASQDAHASEAASAAEAGEPDAAGDDDAHDDERDDQAAGAEAGEASEDGTAAAGDPTKAKRKRRRRRKRKDGSISGEVTAAGAEGLEAPASRPDSKKKESHAPFAHLFSGAQGGKRHAFAVGEVVAGRVQRVEYGVIVVDLFGKAIAIADEYEPRDVPPLPEPPAIEPPPDAAEPASSDVASAESAATEQAFAPSETEEFPDGRPTSVGEPAPTSVSIEVDPLATTAPVLATDQTLPDLVVPAELADESAAQPAAEEPTAVDAGQAEAAVPPLTAADDSAAHTLHAESEAEPQAVPESSSSAGDVFAGHDDDLDDDHDDELESAALDAHREKPEPPKLGQVFKGRVGAISESGHVAILNRIIDGRAVREQLESRRHEHKRVQGVVYGYNRGGFDVLVEGLRAFCPASAMALEDIGDPLDFVGRKLEFLLPASRAGSKDLIVSRRSILERLQRRKTKEFLRSLTPGQRFKGRVTAVRDFGLFVDIGGVEGLVHQSELSFAFGTKPNSVAKVGDEIDVQVLRIGGDARRDSGKKERLTRVSLSVKALLPDPWDAHADALSEGNVLKGKVVRATEFGAFIEIVPEIEGLLHITELGRDLKHGSQAVREGEEIYVAIDRVDRRARRISLSKLSSAEVQQFEAGGLTKDDAAARNLRQGSNVKLKIERIEPRCVFARVVGTVGKRGRAFIPNSETNTERGTDLRKKFPLGSEVEAKIIGIDRDGSFKCSVKAMLIDEERQAVKNYRREAAKQGFGTFGDLLRAKLGEAQTK